MHKFAFPQIMLGDIKQAYSRKIRDDDKSGKIALMETIKVFEHLFIRSIKIAAPGLVLCYEHAAPKKIDEAAVSAAPVVTGLCPANGFFKARKPSAGDAEEVKELIPKGLGLCACVFPLARKSERPVFYFIQR